MAIHGPYQNQIVDRLAAPRVSPPRRRPLKKLAGKMTKPKPPVNVSTEERIVSIASGAILAVCGIARRSLAGVACAGVGGALLNRGITGHCHGYKALGLDTARRDDPQKLFREIAEHGIRVEHAMLVNRTPEELYTYWRNFENLPAIMTHLESVRVLDDRHSHWVAKAPRIAGGSVEWDAEVTRDEPNVVIGWRSLPGSDVDSVGQVRFVPAKGERGTELHVLMEYVPPAGRLGHWIAKLFGQSPQQQIGEDLRNFKRLMETGEIPTTTGQPQGTCTGTGKRSTESQV